MCKGKKHETTTKIDKQRQQQRQQQQQQQQRQQQDQPWKNTIIMFNPGHIC